MDKVSSGKTNETEVDLLRHYEKKLETFIAIVHIVNICILEKQPYDKIQ